MKKEIENLKQEIENLKNNDYVKEKLEEQKKYKVKISEFQSAIERLSSKVNLLA
jgi:cell division protein FtsB